jgi:signal peptidase I
MNIDSIKQQVLEEVDPVAREEKRRQTMRSYLIVMLQFIILIGVIVGVFYMMVGLSTVSGYSMYPTLHDGDVVFYQRSVIDYQSGDVVVVKRPNGEEFVKRVVAVAGDTVNILNGEVYVNGEEIVFDGQIGDTEVMSSEIENPYVVGEDQVYVLGDNRVNSEDSRMFGAVNVSELKGRLLWYMGKL